jgi:hypothetical protein
VTSNPGQVSTYSFIWSKSSVTFSTKIDDNEIAPWKYEGSDNPPAQDGHQNFRINTWVNNPKSVWDGSKGPLDGKDVEVVFKKFTFVPGYGEQ